MDHLARRGFMRGAGSVAASEIVSGGMSPEAKMRAFAIQYHHNKAPWWAEAVTETTAGALRAMANVIEGNGTAKTVAAVAIIVIAMTIGAVSWMGVQGYVIGTAVETSVGDINKHLDGIDQRLDRIEQRMDERGNYGGKSGP